MNHRIHLTSFYGVASQDDPHWPDRQSRLHQSALSSGKVDEVIPWDANKLEATDFAGRNRHILRQKRGYGYWLWKPFIIQQALNTIRPDDYVVYHDVGRPQRNDPTRGYTLDRDIRPLVRWAENHQGMYPGVYMPHHGRQKHWTKRDCFVLMGCDEEKYWEATQIQATYNVWKNTARVRAFVNEWLSYCENAAVLTDSDNTQGLENFPGFKEHRHDQSVLTNLCIKHQVRAYGSPTQPVLLHRNLNSLIRHARFDELAEAKENVLRDSVRHLPQDKFDRSMVRWVELYFAERRRATLTILLIGIHDMSVWQRYAPNADIEIIEDAGAASKRFTAAKNSTERRYDLVCIQVFSVADRQFDLTASLIPRLKLSGLLICGEVKKEWDKLLLNHRSALALMRDAWKNKVVTHDQLTEDQRNNINANLLIAFTAWNKTGETGNAYFVSFDS